jgi:hypothetical protein
MRQLAIFIICSFIILSCSDKLENEPSPNISDTTNVDSLKGARIQAVTTQSTFWRFRDSDGDLFKAKGNFKAWYFSNNISNEEIDDMLSLGTLGDPKLNRNFTEKSFDANVQIKMSLPINSKVLVQIKFNGNQYGNPTYQRFVKIYETTGLSKTKPKVYQSFELSQIDRFRGGF